MCRVCGTDPQASSVHVFGRTFSVLTLWTFNPNPSVAVRCAEKRDLYKDLSTSSATHRPPSIVYIFLSMKYDIYTRHNTALLYTVLGYLPRQAHTSHKMFDGNRGRPLPCCLKLLFSQLWAAPPTWPLPGCGSSLRCGLRWLSPLVQGTAPPPARSAWPPP